MWRRPDSAERMRASWQDDGYRQSRRETSAAWKRTDEYREKMRQSILRRSPLRKLTPQELADYMNLTRSHRYSRLEALTAIRRLDIMEGK